MIDGHGTATFALASLRHRLTEERGVIPQALLRRLTHLLSNHFTASSPSADIKSKAPRPSFISSLSVFKVAPPMRFGRTVPMHLMPRFSCRFWTKSKLVKKLSQKTTESLGSVMVLQSVVTSLAPRSSASYCSVRATLKNVVCP